MDIQDLKDLSDTNLLDFSNIVPQKIREIFNEVFKRIALKGELRSVNMLTSEIATYFVTNGATEGLGIAGLDYDGWAIRNGKNGTDNAGGLVDVGYSKLNPKYNQLSNTLGSENAVLIAHTHTVNVKAFNQNFTDNSSTDGQGNKNGLTDSYTTSTAGGTEDGIGKNMQPSRVVLKLQKI
ncbi:hypothetical protein [Flavobacterium sp.]|uniref:hypothetical protein n=1 Tax=Flavobacterium sp. TaxID=239 RepID=UPI0037515F11